MNLLNGVNHVAILTEDLDNMQIPRFESSLDSDTETLDEGAMTVQSATTADDHDDPRTRPPDSRYSSARLRECTSSAIVECARAL